MNWNFDTMFLGPRKSTSSSRRGNSFDDIIDSFHLTSEALQSKSRKPINQLNNLVISEVEILSISDISSMIQLTRLELPNCSLTSISELNLDKLPNLTYINVSRNKLDNIDGIASCSKLQVLNVSYNQLSKIENLMCENLKALIANHNVLKNIPHFSTVVKDCNTLVLSHNQIDSLKGLAQFRKLNKLVMNNNRIENIEVPEMRFMKKVENIDFSYNEIKKLNVSAWKKMYLLRKLKLSFNKIDSMEEISHLKNIPELSELWLEGNPINKTGGSDLKSYFPNLYKLDDEFINQNNWRINEKKMQKSKGNDFNRKYSHIIDEAIEQSNDNQQNQKNHQSNKMEDVDFNNENHHFKDRNTNFNKKEANLNQVDERSKSSNYKSRYENRDHESYRENKRTYNGFEENERPNKRRRIEKDEEYNNDNIESNRKNLNKNIHTHENNDNNDIKDENNNENNSFRNNKNHNYKNLNNNNNNFNKYKIDTLKPSLKNKDVPKNKTFSKKSDIEHSLKWRSLSKEIPTLKSKTKLKQEYEEKKKNKSLQSNSQTDLGIFEEDEPKKEQARKSPFQRDQKSREQREQRNQKDQRNHREQRQQREQKEQRNQRDKQDQQDQRSNRYQRDHSRNLIEKNGNKFEKKNYNNTEKQFPNSQPTKNIFTKNNSIQENNINTTNTTNTTKPIENDSHTYISTTKVVKDDFDWDKMFNEASASKKTFKEFTGSERKIQFSESGGDALGESSIPKKLSSTNAQESGVVEMRSSSLHKLQKIKKKQSGLMSLLTNREVDAVDSW